MGIEQRLDELSAKVRDRCFVEEGTLRQLILRAHADRGMKASARVLCVLRYPADKKKVEQLEARVAARVGRGLPSSFKAFLSRHDGMWVGEWDGMSAEELLAAPEVEGSLLPAAEISRILETEVALIDQRPVNIVSLLLRAAKTGKLRGHFRVVPFFDVPDQGWHAFDFRRVTKDGRVPVISFYLDGADEQVIAPSFEDWFDGWSTSGFDPFWFQSPA